MNNQKKQSVDKILEELTTKRGKHSELWMWPKKESLEETKEAIKHVVMKAIGEDETPEEYIPKSLTESELSMAHHAVQFHARNKLRAEIRANIEKLFL